MIKLVKTIVNDKRNLIGFVLEGKDKEFDGFSDDKVLKPIPLKVLAEKNFKNKQIEITRNGFIEQGNFRVNDLPMMALIDNKFIDVPSNVELVKKFVQNNTIIGFTVKFGDGSLENFRYNHVIKLSSWFKPVNFMTRTSGTNKTYISGKPGVMKLDDLPTKVLGEESKAKRMKSNAQKQSDIEDKVQFSNGVDIIDLYDAVDSFDGLILKLPNEGYKVANKRERVVAEEFSNLGIGEYSYPKLMLNETKLNVNAAFKKPGIVQIEFAPGTVMPIQSYVHCTKSIFLNAESYIKNFGVAIPRACEGKFIELFGKSMSLKLITDDSLVKPITALSCKNDLVFYSINSTKLDLISKDKLDKYILDTKQLRDKVDEMFIPKAIVKYLSPKSGLINEVKKKYGVDVKKASGRSVMPLYSAMNQEFLEKIKEAGIDIYDGSYNRTIKADESDIKEREHIKEKEDGVVSIDYCIDGKELKKWTYKKIAEEGAKGSKELPAEVVKVVQYISGIKDPVKQVEEAMKIHNEYEKKVEAIKKELWLHKCSMFIKGDNSKIHQDDKDKWVEDTGRRTKATIYNCVAPGCEDLRLAVLNASI